MMMMGKGDDTFVLVDPILLPILQMGRLPYEHMPLLALSAKSCPIWFGQSATCNRPLHIVLRLASYGTHGTQTDNSQFTYHYGHAILCSTPIK